MKQVLERTLLSARAAVIGWYITAVFAWGGFIAALPGFYLWFFRQPELSQFNPIDTIFVTASGIAAFLAALISLGLAVFLFLRKRGDRMALFVSYFLLGYGFIIASPLELIEYMILGETGAISVRAQWLLLSGPTLILMLTFPNGRIVPTRFRRLIPVMAALPLVVLFLPDSEINSIETLTSQLLFGIEAVFILLALGAQIYRYFNVSSPAERQQTKIVLFGLGLFILLLVISSILYYQLPDRSKSFIAEQTVTSLIWWAALSILPISITLAVIRSHLWDIDIVIRRTLVYTLLTVTSGVIYYGSVIFFQSLFHTDGQRTPVSIVISTLIIAALFNPMRRKINNLIDQRFYRQQFDAQKTLEKFSSVLHSEVDLEQLNSQLVEVVQETIQPVKVEVWLKKRGVD